MIEASISEALMWRGITPPPLGSKKTTCPHCSHTRAKADQRCLSVYHRNQVVEWRCYHCDWEDWEIIA